MENKTYWEYAQSVYEIAKKSTDIKFQFGDVNQPESSYQQKLFIAD